MFHAALTEGFLARFRCRISAERNGDRIRQIAISGPGLIFLS